MEVYLAGKYRVLRLQSDCSYCTSHNVLASSDGMRLASLCRRVWIFSLGVRYFVRIHRLGCINRPGHAGGGYARRIGDLQ